MSLPSKKAVLISTFIFLILVVFAVLFSDKISVFADRGDSKNSNQDNFYLTLANGDKNVHFMLETSETGGQKNRFNLTIYQSMFNKQSIELSGFEKYAAIENHLSFQDKDYLFITGDVGAHSKNLVVVKVENKEISSVGFLKLDKSEITLTSDLPHFEFSSADTLDIITFNRDYEKDPLLNLWKEKYQLKNNNFVFINTNPGTSGGKVTPDVQTGGIK